MLSIGLYSLHESDKLPRRRNRVTPSVCVPNIGWTSLRVWKAQPEPRKSKKAPAKPHQINALKQLPVEATNARNPIEMLIPADNGQAVLRGQRGDPKIVGRNPFPDSIHIVCRQSRMQMLGAFPRYCRDSEELGLINGADQYRFYLNPGPQAKIIAHFPSRT